MTLPNVLQIFPVCLPYPLHDSSSSRTGHLFLQIDAIMQIHVPAAVLSLIQPKVFGRLHLPDRRNVTQSDIHITVQNIFIHRMKTVLPAIQKAAYSFG